MHLTPGLAGPIPVPGTARIPGVRFTHAVKYDLASQPENAFICREAGVLLDHRDQGWLSSDVHPGGDGSVVQHCTVHSLQDGSWVDGDGFWPVPGVHRVMT